MAINSLSSSEQRRTRTRALIQLGGLIEKSGLCDVFGISLGEDLQKSTPMKEPVAAFFKGLLELREMAKSDEINIRLWATQGMDAFKNMNISKERPLDKQKKKIEN